MVSNVNDAISVVLKGFLFRFFLFKLVLQNTAWVLFYAILIL